jgi:hypothetical protein
MAFDLFLPIFTAIFLGILYYGRYYQIPLIQYLPYGGKSYWINYFYVLPVPGCPYELPTVLCVFLELPPGDPIPGQASLTSLSLAFAAVTSSLRIFVGFVLSFFNPLFFLRVMIKLCLQEKADLN